MNNDAFSGVVAITVGVPTDGGTDDTFDLTWRCQ